ncbi:uncharacterized protein V6R79_001971 [Siganus canaliculatus]
MLPSHVRIQLGTSGCSSSLVSVGLIDELCRERRLPLGHSPCEQHWAPPVTVTPRVMCCGDPRAARRSLHRLCLLPPAPSAAVRRLTCSRRVASVRWRRRSDGRASERQRRSGGADEASAAPQRDPGARLQAGGRAGGCWTRTLCGIHGGQTRRRFATEGERV